MPRDMHDVSQERVSLSLHWKHHAVPPEETSDELTLLRSSVPGRLLVLLVTKPGEQRPVNIVRLCMFKLGHNISNLILRYVFDHMFWEIKSAEGSISTRAKVATYSVRSLIRCLISADRNNATST